MRPPNLPIGLPEHATACGTASERAPADAAVVCAPPALKLWVPDSAHADEGRRAAGSGATFNAGRSPHGCRYAPPLGSSLAFPDRRHRPRARGRCGVNGSAWAEGVLWAAAGAVVGCVVQQQPLLRRVWQTSISVQPTGRLRTESRSPTSSVPPWLAVG